MPRKARQHSKTSIYHIMIRGNERKNIFLDDIDRIRFIDTLQKILRANQSKLYAYCLMDNHVHLLIAEGNDDIAVIMKKISVSYVVYFNRKYQRIGHLFHDRFRSEPVEDDNYLLGAIRYIHNNPVKAEMVKKASDYRWSSYNLYNTNAEGIIEKETVLSMFSQITMKAAQLFEEFHEKGDDVELIEYDARNDEEKRLAEEKVATEIIQEFMSNQNLSRNDLMKNKDVRNELIMLLRDKGNLSIRRIAELLEINRGVVQKASRR